MKGELAEKITGLVFNCTGIGLGLAGVSVATGGVATLGVGAIAGGLMLRNFMKNPDRLGDARIKRIRRAALKSDDFNQSRSPAELEALDNCLKPFADALELAQITPQTLVSVIREHPDKDFPVCATDYVVARLGAANDIFKSGIEHEFVTHVMSECFKAAIEDRAYYETLDPHVQIEQLKALGRLEAKMDIVDSKVDDFGADIAEANSGISELLAEAKKSNRERLQINAALAQISFFESRAFSGELQNRLYVISGSDSFELEKIVSALEIKVRLYEARLRALPEDGKGGGYDKFK